MSPPIGVKMRAAYACAHLSTAGDENDTPLYSVLPNALGVGQTVGRGQRVRAHEHVTSGATSRRRQTQHRTGER